MRITWLNESVTANTLLMFRSENGSIVVTVNVELNSNKMFADALDKSTVIEIEMAQSDCNVTNFRSITENEDVYTTTWDSYSNPSQYFTTISHHVDGVDVDGLEDALHRFAHKFIDDENMDLSIVTEDGKFSILYDASHPMFLLARTAEDVRNLIGKICDRMESGFGAEAETEEEEEEAIRRRWEELAAEEELMAQERMSERRTQQRKEEERRRREEWQ